MTIFSVSEFACIIKHLQVVLLMCGIHIFMASMVGDYKNKSAWAGPKIYFGRAFTLGAGHKSWLPWLEEGETG